MEKSEREKRKWIPVGIINAKKANNPLRTEAQSPDCGGYSDDTTLKFPGKERARFKKLPEELLEDVPDTLILDEVVDLIGYSQKTILG